MSAPELIRTESLAPLRVTRATLHEMAVTFATNQFERKGEAPCMWLLGLGSKVVWIETPWEDENEKDASVRFIRRFARGLGASCYAFISEAWVSVYDHLPGEGDLMPADRPDAERDDILMIHSADRAEQATTRFLVTIRRHGPNFLGPRVDLDDEGAMCGRMTSVLREDHP